MPVTRSQKNDPDGRSQGAQRSAPLPSDQQPADITISGATRDTSATEDATTETHGTTTTDVLAAGRNVQTSTAGSASQRAPHRDLSRTDDVRSMRSSVRSKKLQQARLAAEEELAQRELEEAQARTKLARARMRRLEEEDADSTEEEDDALVRDVRVKSWIESQEGKRQEEPPLPRSTLPVDKPHVDQDRLLAAATSKNAATIPRDEVTARGSTTAEQQTRDINAAADDLEKLWKATAEPLVTASSIDALAAALRLNEKLRPREPPKYLHELPTFKGDSREWLAFRASYRDTNPFFSDVENVARIRRALGGTAHHAVRSLLLTERDPAKLIAALERRFGRPEALVRAELEGLRKVTAMTDNPRAICVFASEVANCVAAIEAIGLTQHLHHPELADLIVGKMTTILRYRWYDYEATSKEDRPILAKLASFLENEADKCGHYAQPEQPKEQVKGEKENTHGQRGRHVAHGSYTVSEAPRKTDQEPTACSLCTGPHALIECAKFIAMAVEDRWTAAKDSKMCFRCLKKKHRRFNCKAKPCGTDGCKYGHHQLLHEKRQENDTASPAVVNSVNVTPTIPTKTFLGIISVTLFGLKGSVKVYALIDPGSTATMLSKSIADRLGVKGKADPMRTLGYDGALRSEQDSVRVNLKIKGEHADGVEDLLFVRTSEHLRLRTQTVNESTIAGCAHLKGLEDMLVYKHVTPVLLIGQDNWPLYITNETRCGSRGQPIATRTALGWVLQGYETSPAGGKKQVFDVNINAIADDFCAFVKEESDFDREMKEFFSLENLNVEPRKPKSDPEERALRVLEATTCRRPDGRFETGLIWRQDDVQLPNNRGAALRRLQLLEKKFERDDDLREKYTAQIKHLLESGYAERTQTPPPPGKTCYLPHFAVINPAKKKIRIVHDAAAKTAGVSLNDLLLAGPDLLQSLPGVLAKFRQYPVAVTADIKEMFMQIKIRNEDRDALRFLWRDRGEKEPKEYRMTSVVFGAASSPCTAIYVKNRNADEAKFEKPKAAAAIVENHYMDDYLQSFQDVNEARTVAADVDSIHKSAGFELRGWASNDRSLFAQSEKRQVKIGGSEQQEKTLGLLWNTNTDRLGFSVNLNRAPIDALDGRRVPTKREALSIIMSLFDPLGLVSPVTTPAKRLMQETWRVGTGWDEELPAELYAMWNTWMGDLQRLATLRIPRCYSVSKSVSFEMHTFVDASETAYVAATYWRLSHEDGTTSVALACAKSRIAPLKPTSIPRLELQAALLGSRQANSAEAGHDWKPTRRVFWTDSKTVLAWIRSDPRVFKTFVAHRLAEIEENTKVNEWRWVPTRDNVADDATRATPLDFGEGHRWFKGPAFLQQDESQWPQESVTCRDEPREADEEHRIHAVDAEPQPRYTGVPDPARFSTWLKLVRVTARVIQFAEMCRLKSETVAAGHHQRTRQKHSPTRRIRQATVNRAITKSTDVQARTFIPLDACLLKRAEELLIIASQREAFAPEIKWVEAGKSPTGSDRLARLAMYKDERGILRLKSRIDAAKDIEENSLHPAVLDGSHAYTRLYVLQIHMELHHGGVETVVNELRQRVHIIRLRPTVRTVIKNCLPCRLRKAVPASPPTGNHPEARLAHHVRPFTHVGLDYFGPVEVTVGRRREKRYVALFTCLTIRAVHLEVAASLSSDSAIAALRRFMARRGCPQRIYCDNGTNFKGAETELRKAYKAVEEDAANKLVEWKYIPPGAPFMGGAWERLVRTVKTSLQTILHERHPHDETLTTLLAEVENTVNSRPLTHVSVSPEDPESITPNHILLGAGSHMPAPGEFTDDDETAKAMWRRAQALANNFWKRWVREYLPLLQQRREPQGKGHTPQIGDVVIVVDPQLPRNVWPRGRIDATYPGVDGVTRVVDVRMATGKIMRRPVKKVVIIASELSGPKI